jgi:hypothetical protein
VCHSDQSIWIAALEFLLDEVLETPSLNFGLLCQVSIVEDLCELHSGVTQGFDDGRFLLCTVLERLLLCRSPRNELMSLA